jgi:hypothetical protein
MQNINSLYEFLFPLNLIIDLVNVLFLSALILIICKKNNISSGLTVILFFSCFTPFLFNGFLLDWTAFPDQPKYIRRAAQMRNFEFIEKNFDPSNLKMVITKGIHTIFPVPFFEGFKSIGFANRFALLILIIFLVKKNFDKYFILTLIFLPSIILYSSVSLRDSMIIIVSILFFHNFFEKNYLTSFLCLFLLFFIKIQNAVFFLVVILFYSLIFKSKLFSKSAKKRLSLKSIKKYLSSLFLLALLFILMINWNDITELFNTRRYGMYHEAYGNGIGFIDVNLKNLIFVGTSSLFYFFISPIKSFNGMMGILLIIDTIILYLVTYYFFKKTYFKNKRLTYFWFLALIGISFIYGLVIFNDGTIHRYKVVYIIPLIFALLKSSKIKNV